MTEVTNIHREIIRIETDQSSADRVRQNAGRIRAEMEAMRASVRDVDRGLDRFGASATRNFNRVTERADRLRQTLQQDLVTLRDVRGELEQLPSAIDAQAVGRVGTSLRTAGGALRGTQAGEALGAGAGLADTVQGFERLRSELPALIESLDLTRGRVLALGAAGGALAVFGLALKSFADEREREKEIIEEARKEYEAYFRIVQELNLFLVNATRAGIEERLKAVDDALIAAKRTEQEIEDITNRARDQLLEIAGAIGIAVDADALTTPQQVLDFLEVLEEVGVSAPEVRGALEALVTVSAETTAIIDETATATEKLNAALLPTGEALTNFGTVVSDELFRFGRHLQVLGQIAIPQLNAEMDRLIKGGISPLNDITIGLSRTFQNAAPVLSGLVDDYTELIAAQEKAAAVTDKLADNLENFERKTTRDAEDFQRQRTRDLTDHYADLADADADYFRERDDILADVAADIGGIDSEAVEEARDQQREIERLAEDHRDRLLRIERDGRRDISRAASRLDAIALFEAQLAKKDALDDENDQFDKEKSRREEDFQDRLQEFEEQRQERLDAGQKTLDDLRDQHLRERDEQTRDFQQRLQREDEDRAIRVQRELDDFNRKQSALLGQFAVEAGLTTTHYATLNAITAGGMAAVTSTMLQSFTALTSQIGGGGIVSGQINDIIGALGQAAGSVTNNTVNVDGGISNQEFKNKLFENLMEAVG